MKKKRILLLCIYPPVLDGSAYSNYELVQSLSNNGYDVEVLTHPFPRGAVSQDTRGVTVYRVPVAYEYEGNPPRDAYLHALESFIKKNLSGRSSAMMPDLAIVGHESWAWHNTVLKSFNIPVVQHLRGTPTREIKNGIYPEKVAKEYIEAIRLADHIVTVSDYFRNMMVEYGHPKEKITTIHDGVDARLFASTGSEERMVLRSKYGCRDGDKIILHVSNFYPVKRVPDILMSAENVLMHHTDVVYIVVGDGPQKPLADDLFKQSRYKDRIHLIGEVDHVDVPRWMGMSDIFLLASESEGYPRVIMEAQQMGLVLLSSDSDVAKEYISRQKHGLLFRRGDVADLVDKTDALLCVNEHDFETMKLRNIRYAKKHYNALREFEKYHKVIRACMGEV